jgi:hypothetical protein
MVVYPTESLFDVDLDCLERRPDSLSTNSPLRWPPGLRSTRARSAGTDAPPLVMPIHEEPQAVTPFYAISESSWIPRIDAAQRPIRAQHHQVDCKGPHFAGPRTGLQVY